MSTIWKNSTRVVVDRVIQYKAKLSALVVSRPCPSAIYTHCTSVAVLYLVVWFKVFLVVLAMDSFCKLEPRQISPPNNQ